MGSAGGEKAEPIDVRAEAEKIATEFIFSKGYGPNVDGHRKDLCDRINRLADRVRAEAKREAVDQACESVKHGVNCPKMPHLGPGHIHGPDEDGPYSFGDFWYCGRCHRAITPPAVPAPWPTTDKKTATVRETHEAFADEAVRRDADIEAQTVAKLLGMMRLKLAENRDKPNWRTQTLEHLRFCLLQELREIDDAIDCNYSPTDVWKEAADVANLVMMIADHYEKRS